MKKICVGDFRNISISELIACGTWGNIEVDGDSGLIYVMLQNKK